MNAVSFILFLKWLYWIRGLTAYDCSCSPECLQKSVFMNRQSKLKRKKDPYLFSFFVSAQGSDIQQLPASHVAFYLYSWGGIRGGGSSLLLAERVDGSQFSSGASNEEEGRPGRDGCLLHLHYLCPRWLISLLQSLVFPQQRAVARIPQPEL